MKQDEEVKHHEYKAIEKKVIEKTLKKIVNKANLEQVDKTLKKMVEKAVHKALKGDSSGVSYTPQEIALAYRNSESYCEKCGECCCQSNPISVTLDDLMNIASFLGLSYYTVTSNYTKNLKDGKISLKTNPCPFLSNKECSIYPARPNVCRFFPISEPKGKVTLQFFSYCAFCENLFTEVAYRYFFIDSLKILKPELYKKFKAETEKLELNMPKDWNEQIKFADKQLRKSKGA